MQKFRHKGVAVSGEPNRGRQRAIDALHAMMLTIICFTAAIVMDDRSGHRLSEVLERRAGSTVDVMTPTVSSTRTAPAAPEMASPGTASTVVQLSSIEDDPEASGPMRRAPQPRIAGEEKPAATSAVEQPLRAAALHLGEQALRTIHR